MAINAPANNPITKWHSPYMLLNAFEWIFKILLLITLTFVASKNLVESRERKKSYFTVMVIVLAMSYLAWICYYLGATNRMFLVTGLAVMPTLYLSVLGMWRKTIVAVALSVIFLFLHVAVIITGV